MKEIERRELDVPEQIKDAIGGFRLEYRRKQMQTGADRIEIHAFQPSGAEQHRFSRFRVVDDDNGVVAFLKSNHDRPDPYQMALVGLNLAGWETRKNWELEHTEEYEERGKMLQQSGLLLLDDAEEMHPFDADVIRKAAAYHFIAGAIYEFHSAHDDQDFGAFLDEHGADAINRLQVSGTEDVIDLTKTEFLELVRDYLTDDDTDTDTEDDTA